MRRIVSVLVLAVVAALFQAVVPPPAAAGAPVVGRLVDYTTDNGVAGATVRLRLDAGGTPGAIDITATTDADGDFSLMPASSGDYWVEVVRNSRIQGGYVADQATGPSFVAFDISEAAPVSSGTDLGRVLAAPSFISGVVVNAATGNRLPGITVSARHHVNVGIVLGSDITDANGFFRIPISGEEFAIRVKGGARGFEDGWVGCARGVVPSWGDACSHGPGRIGRIRLDRL